MTQIRWRFKRRLTFSRSDCSHTKSSWSVKGVSGSVEIPDYSPLLRTIWRLTSRIWPAITESNVKVFKDASLFTHGRSWFAQKMYRYCLCLRWTTETSVSPSDLPDELVIALDRSFDRDDGTCCRCRFVHQCKWSPEMCPRGWSKAGRCFENWKNERFFFRGRNSQFFEN